jgi:hypothetical protein
MNDLQKNDEKGTEYCLDCGKEYRSGNFCEGCGRKMVQTCNCWVKKEPFNCGKEKCPGYMLLVYESRRRP